MSEVTDQQQKRASALGAHDAHGLMEDIKERVLAFDSEEEKLLWWASFMGYMGGVCAGELGNKALPILQVLIAKTTEHAIQQHMN